MELLIEEIIPPTICLNMIVRNESHIIEKTLKNICDNIAITYWVICDTGSTDNTKQIIEDFFKKQDISGEMYDDIWEDFGHNRTLALEKAFDKTDYLLIFDADDSIHGNCFLPVILHHDKYTLQFGNGFTYKRPLLITNKKRWKFIGVLHEYLASAESVDNMTTGHIEGDYYIESGRTGGRHKDPNVVLKDAQILEKAYIKERDEGKKELSRRYAFYCAQSYKDAGNIDKAIEFYNIRTKCGGWPEELFYSYLQMGKMYMQKGAIEKAKNALLSGYQANPRRIETLYELCKYYRERGDFELANLYFELGYKIPYNIDNLFCDANVYKYLYSYEFYVFYYYLQNKSTYDPDLIHNVFYNLLNAKHQVHNIMSNYKFYLKRLPGLKTPLNIECPAHYVSSTPSIIKHGDGYLINVRLTNVKYENGAYLLQEKNEVTKNKMLIMDASFNITSSCEMDDNEKYTNVDNSGGLFFGTQDIRLLTSPQTKPIYTGVISYIKNNVKMIGVVLGKYDFKNKKNTDSLIISPNKRQCEKNWTLFYNNNGLYCIYEWHPLTIGRFVNGQLKIEHKIDTSGIFEQIRGSTSGYIVKESNEIWFVCHMVSHENIRHYMHIIVILNSSTLDVTRISHPFTFENIPIEYCLGIVVNDDDIVLSYSTNDASSNLLLVSKKDLKFMCNN